MGDAVLEALAKRASGAQIAPHGDAVLAALTERAAGKQFATATAAPESIGAGQLFGDMGKLLVGGVVHGAGTLADIATGTGPGEGSHAERWAAPFEVADRLAQLDPDQVKLHQAVGEGLDATIGTGPLAQTVRERVPQAAEAITTVVPLLKGAGAAAGMERAAAHVSPSAPLHAETNPFAGESLGAAAVSPELKAASPELRAEVARATAAGEKLDRESFDRRLQAESLPIPMKLTKGQASQDVVQISEEMNRRSGGDAELAKHFNDQNRQLIDNLDEIRAQAAPNAVGNDHIQNGQALVDAYKNYDEAVNADIGAKYKALRDANGGDFPVDGPAFVSTAEAKLKKSMKGRYVPAQISADLEEFRSGAMTFENFENMRTNLAAEARKAERSGDGNAAAAVRIVRDALEDLPITGETAALKPLADAARKAAKARFDRLRKDPAYKASVEDSVAAGEASPLADDFINRFVVKGKAANIKAMRETLAADETVPETIAAGALNFVKSKSGVNLYTNEGNFAQSGFNRALAEITPKLDQLVNTQTAEQMQTLGNVARNVQIQPRGSFVNNSNTSVAEHAKNLAKGMAERGVNAILPGADLGSLGREKLAKRAEKQFHREALHPASGITKRGEK